MPVHVIGGFQTVNVKVHDAQAFERVLFQGLERYRVLVAVSESGEDIHIAHTFQLGQHAPFFQILLNHKAH